MAEHPLQFAQRDETWIDNAADSDYFGFQPEEWAGSVDYEESLSGAQLLVDEGSGEDQYREGTLDRPAVGAADYSAHGPTSNVVVFFSWIANMSDEAAFVHSRYWGRMSRNLTAAANTLRWRGAVLSNAWNSPAKERFFTELGGALYSMEEWADIADENRGYMVQLAHEIARAQRDIAKVYRYYLLTEHLRTTWWNPLAQQWFAFGGEYWEDNISVAREGNEYAGAHVPPGWNGLPMPVHEIGGRGWEPGSMPTPDEIIPMHLISPDMDRVSEIASRSGYASVGDSEAVQRLYHGKAAEIVERLAGVYVDLIQVGFREGREFQGPMGLNPSPGGQPPGAGAGAVGVGSGALPSIPEFDTPGFGDFGWDEGGFGPDGEFGDVHAAYGVGSTAATNRMPGTHGADLLAYRAMLHPEGPVGLKDGGHLAGLPVADVAPRMPGVPAGSGTGVPTPGGMPPGAGGFPMPPAALAPPGGRAARQHVAAVDELRAALTSARVPRPSAGPSAAGVPGVSLPGAWPGASSPIPGGGAAPTSPGATSFSTGSAGATPVNGTTAGAPAVTPGTPAGSGASRPAGMMMPPPPPPMGAPTGSQQAQQDKKGRRQSTLAEAHQGPLGASSPFVPPGRVSQQGTTPTSPRPLPSTLPGTAGRTPRTSGRIGAVPMTAAHGISTGATSVKPEGAEQRQPKEPATAKVAGADAPWSVGKPTGSLVDAKRPADVVQPSPRPATS